MAERRGSTTYDPIRDIFTNADEGQADTPDDTQAGDDEDAGPVKSKRKRASSEAIASESPEAPSKPAPQSSEKPSKTKDADNLPPAKRVRSSPPAPPVLKADGTKALNAANLSALPRSKKAPSDRVETKKKPAPRRRERSPNGRQRSRSPLRVVKDTGRRAQRTPPRRRTPSPEPIARTPSPPADETKKLKRPGGGARLGNAEAAANKRRVQEREDAQRAQAQADAVQRGQVDIVSQHYNAVPQRGREWRGQDSKIKGLRSFNNWIKSALIQKFSPNEAYTPGAREQGFGNEASRGLLVLDIGCGKGGDLGKWQAAPQALEYYVGLDPASVSIEQARGRYDEMQRRSRGIRDRRDRRSHIFSADFGVKDCFGESLASVQPVRQVGFDPNAGPEVPGYNPNAGGGFDVVSMMFCLHYAFESEQKARMMLKNVAGALRKDGRFLGVMPNSDVLAARMMSDRVRHKPATKSKAKPSEGLNYDEEGDDSWDPEKPAEANGANGDDDDDAWDPEKPADAVNGDSEDDWDPEKSSEPAGNTTAATDEKPSKDATADETNGAATPGAKSIEWGNSIYRVKFPGKAPPDGVFRPMFGWKYFFFLEEAVEEVPEYVVPWEGFRALALEYDLELRYQKPFSEVWEEYKDDPELAPLSERMKVRAPYRGPLMVSDEEMEAASFYHAFCFYKV